MVVERAACKPHAPPPHIHLLKLPYGSNVTKENKRFSVQTSYLMGF
jgi:hypothetical protein